MKTVAMDFGTFNSAMAFQLPNGGVEFVRLAGQTDEVIPSFLLVRKGRPEQIGQLAKNAWAGDPEHVVWGLKRLLGFDYHDAKERENLDRFRYRIKDHSGKLRIEVDGYVFTPVDLVSDFLRRIREQLCEFQNQTALLVPDVPESLVLAHPAYFDTQQIASLEAAARQAGYSSVQLLREPEAAAMAYRELIDFSAEPLVMVIDWGAGTLDFFIAHFFIGRDGRPKVVEAAPAWGDTKLGGLDIDDVLVRRFKQLNGISELDDEEENQLRSAMEELKIGISRRDSSSKIISLGGRPYPIRLCRSSAPSEGAGRWISLEDTLTDKSYGDLLGRFKENLRYALQQQHLSIRDIDSVILVGGPMCMPCVRAAIAEEFADNNKVLQQLARIETEGFPIDPFKAVAWGAALSDEIDAGPARLPFTYGFLMNGKLVRDLVFPKGTLVARGTEKSAVHDGSIRTRAGDFVEIALYQAGESVAEGCWHHSLGPYEFAPVASQAGTSVVPSMKVVGEICTLMMNDRISDKVLTLPFKEAPRRTLDFAPAMMELLSHEDIEKMLTADPEKYRLYMELWDKGTFSADEVDGQRRKAIVLHKAIRQCINQGRPLPKGAEQLFSRLGEAIPRVQEGKPIEADSQEARTFQEMINARNELIQTLRNESFEY